MLTLTGSANSFSGLLSVAGGTLDAAATGAVGPLAPVAVASGAAFVLGANLSIGGLDDSGAGGPGGIAVLNGYTLTVGGSNNLSSSFSGTIVDGSGPGALVKAGSGVLTLSGDSTFSLPLTIAAGSVQLGSGGTSGSIAANVAVAPGAVLAFDRSDSPTYAGTISGSGGVTMLGSGTTVLSGSNTYSGTTTIAAGILKAGIASAPNVSGAFGNNSAVVLANVAGAGLDISGYNTQIGSLAGGGASGGNVTLGAATLSVGGDNSSTTYAGTISSSGSPGTSLIKIGAGRLTLSGSNTYTGGTLVSAGVLAAGAAPPFRQTPV